jgi:hypothetical protein
MECDDSLEGGNGVVADEMHRENYGPSSSSSSSSSSCFHVTRCRPVKKKRK